jgi:hypothetical protein
LTIVLCSRSERTFPQAFASSDVRLLASMEPVSFFVISIFFPHSHSPSSYSLMQHGLIQLPIS